MVAGLGMGFGSGLGSPQMFTYTPVAEGAGYDQVSLADLFRNPTESLAQLQSNISSNWAGIVVGSLLNEISWKVARKLMSKPVNRFNRAVFGKRGIIGNIGFKL